VLAYLNLTDDYVIFLPYPTKTFTPKEVLFDLIENDEKRSSYYPRKQSRKKMRRPAAFSRWSLRYETYAVSTRETAG
jgi:hypothetical protein